VPHKVTVRGPVRAEGEKQFIKVNELTVIDDEP